MASANRAVQRQAGRQAAATKAAQTRKRNLSKKKRQAARDAKKVEKPDGDAQAGVFIRVSGSGKYQVEVETVGDTRPTEIIAIIDLGAQRAREMLRLE